MLLHSTDLSLTSYSLKTRPASTPTHPERPSTPGSRPQNRAVSSANPSPSQTQSAKIGGLEQPLLRKHQSLASLRDAHDQSSSDQKGFAKFLAAKKADWRGERKIEDVPTPQAGVELGPGTEVERTGGGRWTHFEIHENGEGVGLVDDAIEVRADSSHGSNVAHDADVHL